MTNELIIPESKAEMLALVHSTRAEFSALWTGLSDEEMCRVPGPQSDWSIKDLIAHITWWENFMMVRILLVQAGEKLNKIEHLDEINQQVYDSHKNLSLPQVLTNFENSLPRVLAIFETLTWEEINGGLNYLDDSVLRVIVGNTFGHYPDHQDDLARYVESLK